MLKKRLLSTVLFMGLMLAPASFSQTEEELDKWMKTVGKTMGDLRKANEAKDEAALKAGGAILVEQFTNAAKYWDKHKEHGMGDAVEWNEKTLTAAKALAAGTGTLQGVGSTCKGCHDKYREKLADGSYKLKM
jgi:cytochrome c556